MAQPVVAIVGRPNVGKSTLFNRLVGQRLAIVEDRPGITRDRLQREVEWRGHTFQLVDTGGLTYQDQQLGDQVRGQAQEAINGADLVLFLVDGRQGVVPEDEEAAELLRRCHVPVLLVVNKMDNPELEALTGEFFVFGLGEPFPISAVHGRGIGDLLDRILDRLGPAPETKRIEAVRVAVVGRPNVGKSSLVNRLLGEERVIVSAVPGTTRDAIDSEVTWEGKSFVLVDTAGIRRRSRLESAIEFYSVRRAQLAMEKAQVVLLVLDSTAGITSQDKRLAAKVAEANRAMVIVVNKWDLLDEPSRQQFPSLLAREMAYVSWAPAVFVSALTGRRVMEVLVKAHQASEAAARRVSTGDLNRFFTEVTSLTPPPQRGPRRPKFYYATQASIHPPTFVLFVSQAKTWPASYVRHLENRLREAYDYEGTPLRVLVREAGKKGGAS